MSLFEAWVTIRTPSPSVQGAPYTGAYHKWLEKHNANPPRVTQLVVPEIDCVVHNYFDNHSCVNCGRLKDNV